MTNKKNSKQQNVDAQMVESAIKKALEHTIIPIVKEKDPEIDDFLLWQSRFKIRENKFKKTFFRFFAGLIMFIWGIIFYYTKSFWVNLFMGILAWTSFNCLLEELRNEQ